MKHIFIKIVFFIAYHLGVIRLFYYLTRKRQRVITYHNVIPDSYFNNSIELGVSCSSSVFEFQLNEIAKKFKFTTQLNKSATCVITFDDGYKNNYNVALPILDLYAVKAIFFITYDLVIKGKTLWVDLIMMWCSYVPVGRHIVAGKEMWISDKNRMDAYQNILSRIYDDYLLKENVLSSINKVFSVNQLVKNEQYKKLRFYPLTLVNIEEMKANNHLIACHSISHDILSKLSNKELEDEILSAEKYLGNLYNSDYFAYPFGGVNEVSETVLKSYSASKFKKCFVNYWHFKNNNRDESMQRMSLPNTTNKYVIHAYLSGFYFYFKKRMSHE